MANPVYEMFAKIGVDTKSFEKDLEGAKKMFSAAGKASIAAIGSAATAIGVLVKKSVDSYAQFEQLEGGVKTLFKESADQVMQYAENAYKTAGMSANQYMETVTSFAASLLQSTKNTTEKLTEDEIEARQEALDKQYDAQKNALDKQYDATKTTYDKQYDALSETLDKEADALEKMQDKRLTELKAEQDAEIEAYEQAAEAKIALINKEYTESLKLIDEEKYNQIKAIDEQINAINAQTEAERAAAEKAEQEQRKAELQKAANAAESAEEREKAQKALNDYNAKLEQQALEASRKAQIEGLKAQKDSIKEESDARKEALKTARDEEIAAEKAANKTWLDETKKANAEEISALKESQKEELEQVKKANAAKLDDLKESQAAQLESLKEHNSNRLKEIKAQNDKEKKLLKEGTDPMAQMAAEMGVDTARAAEVADMAIRDMSDNANKMGTAMESIQNAYMGFSKQNYQMLDNLKLGYGGTKTEMERLLSDAEKISGIHYDISSLTDVYSAIHVIQEEMGITGTTAAEASQTIEGSFGSLAAAWQNLITGFARKDADIGGLIKTIVEAAETAFKNILPVAEQALMGIGDFVTEIAPIIAAKIPELSAEIIPSVIEAAISFLNALITGINDNLPMLLESAISIVGMIVQGIIDNLPAVVEGALQIILALATALGEALPELIPAVVDVILQIVDTLVNNVDKMIDAALAIILGLADGLVKAVPKLLDKAPEIIEKLVNALSDNAPKLLAAAVTIIETLADLLIDPEVMDKLIQVQLDLIMAIVSAIIENTPELLSAALKIISALAAGLIRYVGNLTEKVPELISDFVSALDDANIMTKLHDMGWEIIDKVAKGVAEFIVDAKEWGKDLVDNFVEGIKTNVELLNPGALLAEKVHDYIHFSEPDVGPLADFHTYAPDMIKEFAKGIKDNTHLLTDQLESSFDFGNIIEEVNTPKITAGQVSRLMTSSTSTRDSNANREIKLYIGEHEIARAILPALVEERNRVGVSLATT